MLKYKKINRRLVSIVINYEPEAEWVLLREVDEVCFS